jgi:hypothetical protein
VAAERVRALQPNHLQLADVLGVDVGQGAMTRQREIPAGGWPLIGISHTRKLLLIGTSYSLTGEAHHHRDDGPGQDTKLHFHVFLLSLATQFTERKLSYCDCRGAFLP